MRLDDPRRPAQAAIDAAVDSMEDPFDNEDLRRVLGLMAFHVSEELARQRDAGRIVRVAGTKRWRRAAGA